MSSIFPLFNESFFTKIVNPNSQLNLPEEKLKELLKGVENWKRICADPNIKTGSEQKMDSDFVAFVFKKILGYDGIGDNSDFYQIENQFKIKNAGPSGGVGKADLALGFFSNNESKDEAQVLIEFKGSDSDDLDKISNRKDKLSPVNQCWNYLNYYQKAKWGIVTNFNEIRIYNKSKGKQYYQVFYFVAPEGSNKKTLSDKTELLKFILLLKPSNFLTNPSSGNRNSYTEDILLKQGVEEVSVQEKFYGRYKNLRTETFYAVLKNHPEYENTKSKLLELVQKFLDRIIFCWFCEDSRENLIPANILSGDLIKSELKDANPHYQKDQFDIYAKVKNLFRAIDGGNDFGIESGYNGELFKKDKELDALEIPNHIFEKISDIGCDYDFGNDNELNVNILGHIFEQSISDLEELRVSFQELDQTPKKQEKQYVMEFTKEVDVLEHKHIEFNPKKTKRKKEGVFYTPDYINRYMIDKTVGAWLNEKFKLVSEKYKNAKKNKEFNIWIEFRDEYLCKIKILDPACGSGAFLIAAFNYLLEKHNEVYDKLVELRKKKESDEAYLLHPDNFDKTILENNLYGVDLNKESVEITKLALWLQTAVKNRKLNNLSEHIKWGNSLIDDETIVGKELAFNWNEKFPTIMKAGGFDIVVGNPPYGAELEKNQIDDFLNKYKSFAQNYDIYTCFYEKTKSLCKNYFIAGFITPVSWQTNEKYISLRNFFINNLNLIKAIKLPYDIFDDAYIDTGIYIFTDKRKEEYKTLVYDFQPREKIDSETLFNLDFHVLESNVWQKNNNSIIVLNTNYYTLDTKIRMNSVNLEKISTSTRGILASPSDILEKKEKLNDKPFFLGDVYRYQKYDNYKWVTYGTNLREKPNDYSWFAGERILVRRIISRKFRIMATFTDKEFVNKKDLYIFKIIDSNYNGKFILSLINSNLFSFIKTKGSTNATKDDFSQITLSDIRNLPIKIISLNNQKKFIELTDIMLLKNKDLQEIQKDFSNYFKSKFEMEKLTEKLTDWYLLSDNDFMNELKKKKVLDTISLEKQYELSKLFNKEKKSALVAYEIIQKTDKEIDILVYRLYDLTYDEVKIVDPEFSMSKKDYEALK